MTINRRRAPSSDISREKKIKGHQIEEIYSSYINGSVISGTKKTDVIDINSNHHSVKSGKKWQIFLYSYETICSSKYLNLFKGSLESFTNEYHKYLVDREKCIGFKEKYLNDYGKEKAKLLTNNKLEENLGFNYYFKAKKKLYLNNLQIIEKLKDKKNIFNLLNEAIFNNNEVQFLCVYDNTYRKDKSFNIFHISDVLNIFTNNLVPSISDAGRVVTDLNIQGQKIIFKYLKSNKLKNIVEIEVRNDSAIHYRQLRFNMYSYDALNLLYSNLKKNRVKKDLYFYGSNNKLFNFIKFD